jgi:hypothetical protein
VKTDEYLDYVLDIYRAEHPGIRDAAIYQLMCEEIGPVSGIAALMAQRLGADITEAILFPVENRGTDEFLRSFEWRRVRMTVLERDGAKCACCGRTVADGVCMNVDHIKPRKRYPELALDPSNLQVLCNECNHGKGNAFRTDWRAKAPA